MHLRHRGTSGGKWEVVKMSGIANLSLKSCARPATFFFTGSLLRKNSDLCVLCKYLWWISETPEIISRDDEWAWIIAEPLPGIPHGTENNTMPGPGAEKVRRNEAWCTAECLMLGGSCSLGFYATSTSILSIQATSTSIFNKAAVAISAGSST